VVGLPQIGLLDPPRAVGDSSFLILRTACDGLTGLDPFSGAPKPALAASWTLSPGALKLTVNLQPKATFQDGTPVTSEAVREALSRVARPSTASPWADLVSRVEGFSDVASQEATHLSGAKLIDEKTLEIDFSEPSSDFPTILAHPALTPVSLKSLADKPEGPPVPVCAGPYRIQKAVDTPDLRLARVADPSSVNMAFRDKGAGFADLILIRSFDTADDAYEAFNSAQVDIAPVPDSRVGEAQASGRGYQAAANRDITYLAFNPGSNLTSDLRLREALSLALDRLVIIDAAFPDQRQPAVRWLPEEYSGSGTSSCDAYARRIADPARAKQLLKSAGVDGETLRLPLIYDPSVIGNLVIQALQVQVKDTLGIVVEPQPLEGEAFSAALKDRSMPGVWLLETHVDLPLPDQFLGALFRTGSPGNVMQFSDSDFDIKLGDARRATTTEEIRKLYGQAEDKLCSAIPAIPLWGSVSHWMINPQQVAFETKTPLDLFGSPILRYAHAPSAGTRSGR
jgi:oligopeptide transport system substrate-binding protein